MIILTGAAGFIGSVVLKDLNDLGRDDIILFDDLPSAGQFKNLIGKRYISLHSTEEMPDGGKNIDAVVHIGANSNTLEKDWSSIYRTNVLSTRMWNRFCFDNQIPFIFTSTAAVYGNGQGPMNQYAYSKLTSENEISAVILRLFNVYGPNEYHKARMASTVFHWFNQLKDTGYIEIFENSHLFSRDLIYVKDVSRTICYFIENYKPGIYDVGTGNPVDFDSIANCLIHELGFGMKKQIKMPEDLQNQYQSNTKADIAALESAGVAVEDFYEPWQGIKDYLAYLKTNRFL